MSSTQTISEWNGAGQVETPNRSDCNWKAIDDSTSAPGAYPISPSNSENSYSKYQALKFGGTWNSISNVTVKIDSAVVAGLSVVGGPVTAYTTPSRTDTGDSPMSTTGLAVNLVSATSAFGAGSASSTAGGTMYSQAIRTQFKTTSSYAGGPGDTTPRTITWSWQES